MTSARRRAAALAAFCVLCVALAPAAQADTAAPRPSATAHAGAPAPRPSTAPPASPSPSEPPAARPPAAAAKPATPARRPVGLYGTQDPTHDGVWRQSLAMLGQYTAGLRPADPAILWLKGQQCADGAFPVYRAEPTVPCGRSTDRDVDATAVAMQALASVAGQRPSLNAAINWLRTQQNKDGGWGAKPGAPTDAHSTSLVIGALAMAGARPSSMRSPFTAKQAYDALLGLSIPCASPNDGGAFAARAPAPGGRPVADGAATAAALLGGLGKRIVAAPVQPGPAPTCSAAAQTSPEGSARNGAAYLARFLSPAGGHLTDTSGAGDPAATADAVVAMCAGGYGDKAVGALRWLEDDAEAWTKKTGPSAYAQLIFVAHTAGVDPHRFGGIDLVKELNATGPAAPTPVPLPSNSAGVVTPSPTPPDAGIDPAIVASAADADTSPVLSSGLWFVAIGVVVLIAIGVVVVNRRSPHGDV